MSAPMLHSELENLEIQLLLESVYQHYGYDFREYASASLKRRIAAFMTVERISTVSRLQECLLHDRACMERFLIKVSVSVTSMFRDPEFFRLIRETIVPTLRTYPFLRIWHAGCSTGEEVYSMAILLQEEGLYDRCRIYATDMNEAVLQRAREGIFPLECMQEYATNYRQAGGKESFSSYYTAGYGNAIFRSSLRSNVVFSQHNLATDRSFNEFNMILCRNVLIYFKKSLQLRVHNLLYDSLAMWGILGLGSKETLQFTPHEQDFQQIESGSRLYRRIR
ncbi:MAG: CheR family methyltransferase [Armatimonadota bacterium]